MEVNPLLTDLQRQQTGADIRPLDKGPRPSPAKARRAAPEPGPTPVPIVTPRHRWYLPVKAGIDFGVALVLLVLAAPVILALAALVKLTSRGPAFYMQTRVGKDGRLFTIYKIRTMVHECESLTGPRWSIPGDPRITRVGQFLRLTHTDELPQLLNVLRGDMSLIGPRPERPEFLPKLERVLPMYRNRLAVRPGITGLAQVNLAADTDVEDVRRKLMYDLYYIQRVNPWLELRILAATVFYALGNPGELSHKLRMVPRGAVVENRMTIEVRREDSGRERKCA